MLFKKLINRDNFNENFEKYKKGMNSDELDIFFKHYYNEKELKEFLSNKLWISDTHPGYEETPYVIFDIKDFEKYIGFNNKEIVRKTIFNKETLAVKYEGSIKLYHYYGNNIRSILESNSLKSSSCLCLNSPQSCMNDTLGDGIYFYDFSNVEAEENLISYSNCAVVNYTGIYVKSISGCSSMSVKFKSEEYLLPIKEIPFEYIIYKNSKYTLDDCNKLKKSI